MPYASHAESPASHYRGGPRDPFNPIDDPEVIVHSSSGAQILRQKYADGYLYEYMAPCGAKLDYDLDYVAPAFEGRMLHMYEDNGFIYLSVWVPHAEQEPYNEFFCQQAQLPEVQYSTAEGTPEEVYRTNTTIVSQTRYSAGWLFSLSTPMGVPWPYLPEELTVKLVQAPIASVRTVGRRLFVQFWVSDQMLDNSPAEKAILN